MFYREDSDFGVDVSKIGQADCALMYLLRRQTCWSFGDGRWLWTHLEVTLNIRTLKRGTSSSYLRRNTSTLQNGCYLSPSVSYMTFGIGSVIRYHGANYLLQPSYEESAQRLHDSDQDFTVDRAAPSDSYCGPYRSETVGWISPGSSSHLPDLI